MSPPPAVASNALPPPANFGRTVFAGLGQGGFGLSGVDLSAPADDFGIAIPHGVLRRFGALIGREIALERERWPLWLPAFLGAGIATYFALTVEPACWIGWTAPSRFLRRPPARGGGRVHPPA